MTKKKMFNIAELAVQLIALFMLVAYHGLTLVEDMDFRWAQEVELPLGLYTYFNLNAIVQQGFFPLVMMGLMVLNAAICLVSVISKDEKRDGVTHTVIAVTTCVLSLICINAIAAPIGYDVIISPVFRILGVLFAVAVAILAVTKRSKYVVAVEESTEKETTVINNIQANTSNADELKKYKDLLDSGVISQEEFDAKKKQLLNL